MAESVFRLAILLGVILMALSTEASDLQVLKSNPHYFSHKGQPVFLIGATHLDGWTPICMRSRDYTVDLERLAYVIKEADNPHVLGLVRVIPYFPDHEGPQPWAKLEDGRYDLSRFDLEWERRLKDYLDHARKLGLIVSLEVWEDFSITRQPGTSAPPGVEGWRAWGNHPFNPDMNVNYGTDVLPNMTEVEDPPFYRSIPERENNPKVLEFQRKYADRLLTISRPYSNVIYNISNETRASFAWSRYWARYVRKKVGDSHLITEMPSSEWKGLKGESDPELNPMNLLDDPLYDYVDISQVVCKHVPAWESTAHEHAMGGAKAIDGLYKYMETSGKVNPLLVSKHYASSRPNGIPVLWGMFTAGAAGVRYHRPFGTKDPAPIEDFQFEQVLFLARFLKDVEFWKMRPAHDLASVPEGSFALVLAEEGRDYIVQILAGKGGELKLDLPAGDYSARWFDPSVRRAIGEAVEIKSAGGPQTISIPKGKSDLIIRVSSD